MPDSSRVWTKFTPSRRFNYGDNSNRCTRQNQLRQGVPPRQSPSQRQSRERGVDGCRDERNDQSPHHQPSAEATGADRQSAWEDQERRQGKGSLQHARDGNRYSSQDQLRQQDESEDESDRQSGWELQNSRQGEVSPQTAQNSNRHTRQDQLLERVPQRPSRRQRQNGQRGVDGSRIRRDHQRSPRLQGESILGSDGQH